MAEPTSHCPSENDLLAFVAGATEQRADVERHLAGCERCRVAVANLVSRTASSARAAGQQRRGDEVGRYVVLELVGEGAMGRVYAAYDPVLDRKVALKLLHPLVDGPDGQQRLLREAKALAKVAHPHLVAVHDAGTFQDSVFLAMEFVDGQTLRAWLAADKRSADEVLDAFLQAGRGLAAAHAAGLVHRDFKPENVLVGRDGRVRVSDFGLARELGAALSKTSLEALALPSVDAASGLGGVLSAGVSSTRGLATPSVEVAQPSVGASASPVGVTAPSVEAAKRSVGASASPVGAAASSVEAAKRSVGATPSLVGGAVPSVEVAQLSVGASASPVGVAAPSVEAAQLSVGASASPVGVTAPSVEAAKRSVGATPALVGVAAPSVEAAKRSVGTSPSPVGLAALSTSSPEPSMLSGGAPSRRRAADGLHGDPALSVLTAESSLPQARALSGGDGATPPHAGAGFEQTAKPAPMLMTATGALVGTPAYMAPEQLAGQRADPRADQFAFCVALAEALQGTRPFTKNSAEVVRRGPTLRTSPRRARALQRGLALEPRARFASMEALLEALAPPAFRPSTLVVPVAAVVLALVAVAAFVRQRSALCASGPQRVAAVWSTERRQQLRAHFSALGGDDTFQRIDGELDRWTTAWAAQHREACEATRLRGEQSDQVFTVRMACLDRRLVDLQGALGVLATTSSDSLPRAQDPVLSLTPLTVCTNTAALLVPVPRPEAPALRERADAIERELSRAQALRESGRFVEGLPIATSAALQAHGLGWAPLEAEALFVRGQLLEGNSDLPGAESALRDAFTRAHAARDDRLATLVAIELSFVASQQARLEVADEWVWQASALAPRVGIDWELASKLANQQGHLHSARSEFASAEVRYRTAWELRRDHQGPSHPKTASILANLASSIGAQGRYEQSAELLTEVARQLEASLGRSHHKVGQAWNGVAEQDIALHRPAKALALIDGIFAEQLAALGPSSQYVGRLRYGRAEALRGLGRLDEAAAEYRQALEVFEAASMPLMAGITLGALGATACRAGRLDEGLTSASRARDVLLKAFGEAHEEATVALEVQGECLLEAAQPQRALAFFTRSLEAREKAGDDDWTARSLVGLGRTHLALGHRAEGRALLTRAVRSLERSKLDAVLLATARTALGEEPALDVGR